MRGGSEGEGFQERGDGDVGVGGHGWLVGEEKKRIG